MPGPKLCGYAPVGQGPENQPPGGSQPPNNPRLLIPDLPVWAGPEGLQNFSLSSPAVQYWGAMLCRAMYAPADSGIFNRVARAVVSLGAPVTITPAPSALIPAHATIRLPSCNVCVIPGTTTLAQWLTQFLQSTLAPTGFAPAAPPDGAQAPALYVAAANSIAVASPDLMTRPTLYCGHSMGGAVAELLWHRARRLGNNPGKVLTYGAPKPGSEFLRGQLPASGTFNRRLFIDGDFIPTLPPDLGVLQLAVPPAFQTVSMNWAQYRHPGAGYQLGSLGTLTEQEPRDLPLAVAGALAAIVAGQPITAASSHITRTFCDFIHAGFSGWGGRDVQNWNNPAQLDQADQQLRALNL